MAFPTVTAHDLSDTSCAVPARNAGDLVILVSATNRAFPSGSRTPTPGALDGVSWTALGFVDGTAGSTDYLTVHYLFAGSTSTADTISITPATGWSLTTGRVLVISGAHATTPPAMAGIASSNPPSLNPSGWDVEDTLWIAASSDSGFDLTGIPSGYTSIANGIRFKIGYRNSAAASEDPGSFGSAFSCSSVTIAVRPAAAPPPVAGGSLMSFFH